MRGDVDTVVAASTYVEAHGFAPFDAFVPSDPMATRSCPHDAHEGFAPRFDLKDGAEARDGIPQAPLEEPHSQGGEHRGWCCRATPASTVRDTVGYRHATDSTPRGVENLHVLVANSVRCPY
jgi:hypothetical protein